MSSRFRNVAVLLLAVFLTVLVIGCSGSNTAAPEPENSGTPSSGTTTGTPAPSVEDKSPITLTMFSSAVNNNYEKMESPVGKKITEETGVTLKIEYPIDNDNSKQKLALMAASGDYPDLVFVNTDANIMVSAGAFIDLTPLIEEHGPNIKKLYGDYLKRHRWSKDDPSIYFLGSYGVDEQSLLPVISFNLQHAVVKELGYPKLETLQDYENAIKAYIEKHPTIDGQPTIGLSLLATTNYFATTIGGMAAQATGGVDDGDWYVDPKTQKATYLRTRPEEREYFRWLNHMNDIGLLDPESMVQNNDQYLAKIASGRVLALTDGWWHYAQAEQALRQAGKEDRNYGMYPITLNKDIVNHVFQNPGYSPGSGIGITTSAKDPVRAIKFLDWMASEEAQILNNWGIEGVNYNIADGKRVIPQDEMDNRRNDPEYAKKTGIGVYGFPFPQYGNGVLDSTGQTYTIASKQSIIDNTSETAKDILSHYNAEMWMDLYPSAEDLPVRPWGKAWQINYPEQDSEANVIAQQLSDIVFKKVPEAILAKPENFDKVWDDFMAELENAGVHKLEELFNQLLAERIKLWNE